MLEAVVTAVEVFFILMLIGFLLAYMHNSRIERALSRGIGSGSEG